MSSFQSFSIWSDNIDKEKRQIEKGLRLQSTFSNVLGELSNSASNLSLDGQLTRRCTHTHTLTHLIYVQYVLHWLMTIAITITGNAPHLFRPCSGASFARMCQPASQPVNQPVLQMELAFSSSIFLQKLDSNFLFSSSTLMSCCCCCWRWWSAAMLVNTETDIETNGWADTTDLTFITLSFSLGNLWASIQEG